MSSRFSRAWRSELWRLALASLVALAIGAWLHAIAACLLSVAVASLALGFYRLHRFGRGLESGRRSPDASGWGLWAELEYGIAGRRKASFEEKRHLLGLLRAFRDAASALPDAVVALDGDHRIQWFNAAARHLLGLKYPED